MKNIFLVILLLLLAAPSYADQKAITDTGEQVVKNRLAAATENSEVTL